MHTDLADWFHLITAPDEYVEEADFYMSTLIAASNGPIRDLLELGSGAGNNASQYKRQHWIARSSTGSGTSSY